MVKLLLSIKSLNKSIKSHILIVILIINISFHFFWFLIYFRKTPFDIQTDSHIQSILLQSEY